MPPGRTTSAEIHVDRSRLPSSRQAAPFRFPVIEKTELASGVRVWSSRHAAIPVVTLIVVMNRGAAADPSGAEGLAAITVDMLDEGSDGRSAIEIHQALARIGAQLDSEIGPDGAALTVSALSRFTPQALSLVGDMVARPTLAADDFDRVRNLRLNRLRQLRDVPGAVADRTFARLLYGTHPYGHTPLGAEAALRAITVQDVRAFHMRHVRPAATTVIAVGDCHHTDICALVEQSFAGWNGMPAPERVGFPDLPVSARLNVVPRAGAPQSELRIGHVSVARSTPDYHALLAANMVLGGQFVSRINLNLREEKGFTYGARTAFDFRRLPGPFSLQVSVQTAATGDAVRESLRELDEIRGARPITPDELGLGVAALTKGFPRNFETAEQIARAMSQLVLYDLPDTYFEEFVPAIERLTAQDVTRAAREHLHPDRMITLIVGDFDVVHEELARLGLGAPVALSAESF
jgi:predicted Zn-dependent peptidase